MLSYFAYHIWSNDGPEKNMFFNFIYYLFYILSSSFNISTVPVASMRNCSEVVDVNSHFSYFYTETSAYYPSGLFYTYMCKSILHTHNLIFLILIIQDATSLVLLLFGTITTLLVPLDAPLLTTAFAKQVQLMMISHLPVALMITTGTMTTVLD